MTNLKDIEQASYTAPVVVSDEMVQDMPERIYATIPSCKGCVVSFDIPSLAYDTEYVRADVVAALSSAPSVKVKELEWDDYAAKTDFGAYTIGDDDYGWFFTFHDYPYGEADEARFLLIEEAKAAAQADFERRILSALQTTQPEPAVKVAEWQPIETAPRDGTVIDLWANPSRVGSCRYTGYLWDDGRWCQDGLELYTIGDPDVSHWMPLPAAPLNPIGGAE